MKTYHYVDLALWTVLLLVEFFVLARYPSVLGVIATTLCLLNLILRLIHREAKDHEENTNEVKAEENNED